MDTDSVISDWQESSSREHNSPANEVEPTIDRDSNPLWKLYETIQTHTNKDGLRVSEYFSEVPSAEDEPTGETENNSLSMLLIRKRLISGFYDYVSEIAEDFNTLWEDIKKLNEPTSELHQYAVELQGVMQNKVQELIGFQYQGLESDENSTDELFEPLAKDPLKERLQSLYKCLTKYKKEDGSHPILHFMVKPSRKLHPDFYERIQEPINMLTIEKNIESDKYGSEEELLKDLKLMFCHYREYYGEGSPQYKHSIALEKVLTDRTRVSGVPTEESSVIPDTAKVDVPGTFVCVSEDHCTTAINAEDDTTGSTEAVPKRRRGKEKDPTKRKIINGYILFSSVSRSTVKANNADKNLSFGDISRIVGSEWKKLSFAEKCSWEKKADHLNKKNDAKFHSPSAQGNINQKLVPLTAAKPERLQWECLWENCNRVYKNRYECTEHATGHVSASFNHSSDGEFQCRWNNCARIGKGSAPFPCLQKLVRHVKDVHILKGQSTDPLSDPLKNNNARTLSLSDPLMSEDYSDISDPLTRRLYSWCKLLLEIKTNAGRQPMLSFIGKPLLVPTEQTREPENMWAMYRNISANKYSSEEELLNDFNLMFRNFREQYPNDSSVCEDADTLERILVERARTLGLHLNGRSFISNLVKVQRRDEFEGDSKTQPAHFGISIEPSNGIENAVMKVEPSSVDCKNVIKLEVPDLSAEHNLLPRDNGTSTSNCSIMNTAMEVDPALSWTLSAVNTEQVDCKAFIKSEAPSTFNGASSAVPINVTIPQTPNANVATVPMNSSYVLLISSAAPINGENFMKVETQNASNVYLNAMANNVGILGTSNDSVANMIVNSSGNQPFENNYVTRENFIKVEQIDFTEDMHVGSSDASMQKVPGNGSASQVAKPQKGAQSQQNRKPFNGFILYSREARKSIAEDNPQMSFGEISRTIGAQWMKLSKHEKKTWGDEAARISQEGVDRQVAEASTQRDEMTSGQLYWECQWDNCDNIFETQRDCLAHATAEQSGHVISWFADPTNRSRTGQIGKDRTYQCEWNNCSRIKKGAPPFPSLHRLVRHVREVHLMKNPGRRFAISTKSAEENLNNHSSDSGDMSNIIIVDTNHLPVNDCSGEEEGIIQLD